jgi:hypothetical protein
VADFDCIPDDEGASGTTFLSCSDVWEDLARDEGGEYSCGARIEWVQSNQGKTLQQSQNIVANEFPAIRGACYDPITTAKPSVSSSHFVVIEDKQNLALAIAENSKQDVEGAAEINFSRNLGTINVPLQSAVTSYSDVAAQSEARCVVLNSAPGDEPLIVGEDRKLLCSSFSAV